MAVGFEELSKINVNDHTEDKNGLTYLSWVWAWSEFKKQCPKADYEIIKQENGLPYVFDENTGSSLEIVSESSTSRSRFIAENICKGCIRNTLINMIEDFKMEDYK